MRLTGVEAARGIAALFVVMYHASRFFSGPRDYGHAPFGGIFLFGRAGVDFFFVLSGFIICYIHARDLGRPASFRPFWYKRLVRVYPIYWVATALFGVLLFYSPTRDRAEQQLGHIVASLLLLPEASDPILGVGWSLRHEIVFYGLFGVLILSRRLGAALLAAWAAAIAFNAAWALATGAAYFTSPAGVLLFRIFNIQFFLGMAVAVLARRAPPWRPRLMLWLGVALFLAAGLYEDYGPRIMPEWPPLHLTYGIGAAMALYGVATLDAAGRVRLPAGLVGLGTASYSIYLFHIPVLIVVQGVLRAVRPALPLPLEAAFVVSVAAATAAGVALSLLIEQPLLRFARRPSAAAPQAVPSITPP